MFCDALHFLSNASGDKLIEGSKYPPNDYKYAQDNRSDHRQNIERHSAEVHALKNDMHNE